jgi:hypothetical protein
MASRCDDFVVGVAGKPKIGCYHAGDSIRSATDPDSAAEAAEPGSLPFGELSGAADRVVNRFSKGQSACEHCQDFTVTGGLPGRGTDPAVSLSSLHLLHKTIREHLPHAGSDPISEQPAGYIHDQHHGS